MGSSIYTAWSVVAGEQPTTAKWNILGTNDASFNNGYGFNDALIIARHLSASALGLIFPIGAIYTETTGVNPSVTFGFGTWATFGAGRVLVGVGTSDETFNAGTSGGESNHTLNVNEMPSHNHLITQYFGTSGGQYGLVDTGNSGSSGANHPVSSTGGGAAHNNLQPYIVVYFWERTA